MKTTPNRSSSTSLLHAVYSIGLFAAAGAGCAFPKAPPPASPAPVAAPAPGADCPTPAADAGKDVPAAERGFSPIGNQEMLAGAHKGKTLFAGVSELANWGHFESHWRIERPQEPIFAGDALTLCEVASTESTTGTDKGPIRLTTATAALVKTAKGEVRVYDSKLLSEKPLAFSLRNPGTADQLIADLFVEGYHGGKSVFDKMAAADWVIEPWVPDGAGFKVNEVYRQGEAFRDVVRGAIEHLHHLTLGGYDRRSVMSSRDMGWITKATDDKILDWYVDGPPKASRPPEYADMLRCVKNMDNMVAAGRDYYEGKKEMEAKPWRKGLMDASESKLATLDQAEMDRRQKRNDQRMKIMTDAMAFKGCKTGLSYAEPRLK
jgi:hypothetical protein